MTITEQLAEALRDLYDMCLCHGDFGNGVTDATGTIDEGEVMAGDCLDKARASLAAYETGRAAPAQDPDIDGLVDELWQDLLERDDRTSPEEHPDMALITRDELRAALAAYEASKDERLTRERDEARRALRELPCPRPANCDPDDTTIGQCYDKGNCGCIYGRRGLSAGEG